MLGFHVSHFITSAIEGVRLVLSHIIAGYKPVEGLRLYTKIASHRITVHFVVVEYCNKSLSLLFTCNHCRDPSLPVPCPNDLGRFFSKLLKTVTDSPPQTTALLHQVDSAKRPIEAFLAQTEKYRRSLSGGGSGSMVRDSWRKVGWSLHRKEDVKALRDVLQLRLLSINVLLSTAC